MTIKFLLRLTFFILTPVFCLGQSTSTPDTTQRKKISILPLPAFGYTPETRAYIGAVGLITLTNKNFRTSNLSIEFNYTQNKQSILGANWNLFINEERWLSTGTAVLSKYPDLYFGIGKNTPNENEISYNSRRFEFDIDFYRQLRNNWFAGLVVRNKSWRNIELAGDKKQPSIDSVAESDVFGLGLAIIKDSRNNILNSIYGNYFGLSISNNFTDNNTFQKILFDVRQYYSINRIHTLAFRLLTEFNTKAAPFNDMAMLGGDARVRGYYFGRYRDNHFYAFQAEYRSLIYKRFGYAVFGGVSDVSNSVSNFSANSIKPNAGIGLRFLIDRREKINLRFDYAIGIDGQDGFYISFGESF